MASRGDHHEGCGPQGAGPPGGGYTGGGMPGPTAGGGDGGGVDPAPTIRGLPSTGGASPANWTTTMRGTNMSTG